MKEIDNNQLTTILASLKINPDPEWVSSTRDSLIKMQLEDLQDQKPTYFLSNLFMNTKLLLSTVAVAAIAITGGGAITVQAAKAAVPGDFLFGLGKTIENIQRGTISAPEQKLKFEQEILKEREVELEHAKEINDDKKIKLAEDELNEQEDRLSGSLDDSSVELEREHEQEKTTLEQQQEAEKKAAELKSETEKKALEQQQEQQKQQLEAEQEAQKQALEEQKHQLEQQQEAEKKAAEQQKEDSNNSETEDHSSED